MTKKNKDLISLIVPSYNEEESVDLFVEEIQRIKKEMDYVDFEIIFVDDGSKDKTLEKLRAVSSKYDDIKYISFSKNYGKEYAMIAGFDHCNGDYITVIDADLQHPPKLLIDMYKTIKEGEYDCIAAKSIERKNYSIIRKAFTNFYYKLINSMTEVEMVKSATDYRLMTRQMLEAIKSIREHNRYLKGIFEIVGFKTKWIEYKDNERIAGTTKWNMKMLFKYAMTGIISFSQMPLLLVLYTGIFLAFVTFILLILTIIFAIISLNINWLIWNIWLAVSFLGSLILIANGIIGLYIAEIQTESKNRPLYIIKEKSL